MKRFLQRPVPMWTALCLGLCFLVTLMYAAWSASYFNVLADLVRKSEEGQLVKPMQSMLMDPELCRAHWSYWPRVIYHMSTDVCHESW